MAPRKPKEQTEGFPKQGDVMPDPPAPPQGDPGDEDEPEVEEEEDDEPPEPKAKADDPAVAALKAEVADLRRQIPPAQPKQVAAPPKEEEPDWDNLIFTKPKEAVKLIKEAAIKQAKAEMAAEYNKDQGTKQFWAEFNAAHPDLKDDRDLVEMTLNSNLDTLANIPVPKAIEMLADLTRDRILRYSGGVKPKGKKAMAEGSGGPTPKPPAKPTAEVTSLSDIIKARRNKRRGVAA